MPGSPLTNTPRRRRRRRRPMPLAGPPAPARDRRRRGSRRPRGMPGTARRPRTAPSSRPTTPGPAEPGRGAQGRRRPRSARRFPTRRGDARSRRRGCRPPARRRRDAAPPPPASRNSRRRPTRRPGADARAKLQRDLPKACLASDRTLQLDGAGKASPGGGERRDEAVAHHRDGGCAVRRQRVARDRRVRRERGRRQRPRARHARPRSPRARHWDRRRRTALLCLWGCLGGPGPEQRGIVGEDRLLHAFELRSGLEPQLGVQCRTASRQASSASP